MTQWMDKYKVEQNKNFRKFESFQVGFLGNYKPEKDQRLSQLQIT